MKKKLIVILFMLVASFCFMDGSDNEPIFQIGNFTFLDEYPNTIVEIESKYDLIQFEEKRYDSFIGGMGKYSFALRSDEISFYLYGDSRDTAELTYLEINSVNNENERIRLIGYRKDEILVTLKALDVMFNVDGDKIIIHSRDYRYFIEIDFIGDTVSSYSINKSL